MMVPVCNPSNRETEKEEPGVQNYPQLHDNVEATLGYTETLS